MRRPLPSLNTLCWAGTAGLLASPFLHHLTELLR